MEQSDASESSSKLDEDVGITGQISSDSDNFGYKTSRSVDSYEGSTMTSSEEENS